MKTSLTKTTTKQIYKSNWPSR